VNIPHVVLWGFLATLLLTTLEAAARGLGLSRMSMPFLVGTMLTPNRDRASLVGFFIHLINGWFFALIYALIFEALGWSTWWQGAILGAAHGFFVLAALMPLMPSVHPRMASETHGPTPTRELQPPGFMALHYGRQTMLVTLLAHVIFGAVLGGLYEPRAAPRAGPNAAQGAVAIPSQPRQHPHAWAGASGAPPG
jgi:hypothetical protein